MKNEVTPSRSILGRIFSELSRNIAALFVSSEMREYRRLKNFIGS